MEEDIEHVTFNHCEPSLLESFIVLYFFCFSRGIICSQRSMDEVATFCLEGLVENFKIQTILNSLGSIFSAQCVRHIIEILEREWKLLVLLDLLHKLEKVLNCLAKHYCVVTLISRHWCRILVDLSESGVCREASSSC